MAAVIHSLWEKGRPQTPLILPANIAIDDPRVQFELTRYLTDKTGFRSSRRTWTAPARCLCGSMARSPNLGKFAASRRVARAIYLGSAPTADAAQRGIEDRPRQARLRDAGGRPRRCSAMRSGGSPAPRRTSTRTVRATGTPTQADRHQARGRPRRAVEAGLRQGRAGARDKAPFQPAQHRRIQPHSCPGRNPARTCRTTAMRGWWCSGTEHALQQGSGQSRGERPRRPSLESRGKVPRIYRNTLVFLAVDKTRLPGPRRSSPGGYLAWDSILGEREPLDLSPASGQAGRDFRRKAASQWR